MVDVLDVPEQVKERWADKAAALESRPLALPYASSFIRAMVGQHADAHTLQAAQWMIARYPDELPLDIGPARCKALDRKFVDAASRAGRLPRSLQAAEASWVATDEALHYVAPLLNMHQRWAWPETQLRVRKHGRHFTKIALAVSGQAFELSVGSVASANLLAAWSWSRL